MESLDALVRRVDEDRWLASRFAPRPTREPLIALYALNYEIARAAEGVSNETLGEMRLLWWRDALDEIHGGSKPRAHPVLQAYAQAPLSAEVWNEVFDARAADVSPEPFATWNDIEAYARGSAGGLLRLAAQACGADLPRAFADKAGEAWALTGLIRATPFWTARGRSFAPTTERGADVAEDLIRRAAAAYDEARKLSPHGAAFPAFGYVALVPTYLRALGEKRAPSLLARQSKLVAASLTSKL
jgi:phytoene synthase